LRAGADAHTHPDAWLSPPTPAVRPTATPTGEVHAERVAREAGQDSGGVPSRGRHSPLLLRPHERAVRQGACARRRRRERYSARGRGRRERIAREGLPAAVCRAGVCAWRVRAPHALTRFPGTRARRTTTSLRWGR
jgi:hypothetical protein